MKLRRVDPKTIKWPEVRVTAQFDPELYEQFKASIKEVGQIAPIICYQVGEELVGCDGKHRCDEAIAAGESSVDVVVIPGDMVDVLTKNIFLDHLRGKTPVGQMVKVIKTLYQDYNLDSDQIREKTGLTRDYIEKLIKIGQASKVVIQALDQGWIGVGVAFQIARLPHPLQQEEIIAKQRVYNFKVDDIKELVDKTLEEMELMAKQPGAAAPAETAKPREWRCEGCHEVVEPRYLRPVMLCPDCFGNVWRLAKARETVPEKSQDSGGEP